MLEININKRLLPMKAHYFLWNAGTGPVVPFLSTYARQLGFSSVIVGIIYTILPICGMLAKPTVGAIADRFRCQKGIFLAAQILTAIAFLATFYAPEVPIERKVHFSCDYGRGVFDTSPTQTVVDQCLIAQMQDEGGIVDCHLNCLIESENWNTTCHHWFGPDFCSHHTNAYQFTANIQKNHIETFNGTVIFPIRDVTIDQQPHTVSCECTQDCPATAVCDVECDDYNVNEIIFKAAVNDDDAIGLYQFWIFLLLMIAGWVGQAMVVSLGDAICFEMLGDKPNRYGYQRLFGALGWGIFSTISGFMVDAFSEGQSKKDYTSAFYLAFSILLLDFLVSYTIQYTQKKHTTSILRDVGNLLVDIRVIIFLLWCISVGLCTGLIWQFLFWLIEDLAKNQGCEAEKWVKTLEGLVMAIQCLCGELPFFFLSGWILKKIGHINAMSLVLFVIGIRYVIYSVIPNPWYFLPVELLNGLTFGLFYACMASYASIIAPPGTEATMQGLVGAVFEGVGVSLGSFIGGLLYNSYGGPMTFRIFGIGSLIVCVLHYSIQFILKSKDNAEKDYNDDYDMPKDRFKVDEAEQELSLVGRR